MKKVILIIGILFITISSYGQSGIVMTKKNSQKGKILYEGTRIKIKLENKLVLKENSQLIMIP